MANNFEGEIKLPLEQISKEGFGVMERTKVRGGSEIERLIEIYNDEQQALVRAGQLNGGEGKEDEFVESDIPTDDGTGIFYEQVLKIYEYLVVRVRLMGAVAVATYEPTGDVK